MSVPPPPRSTGTLPVLHGDDDHVAGAVNASDEVTADIRGAAAEDLVVTLTIGGAHERTFDWTCGELPAERGVFQFEHPDLGLERAQAILDGRRFCGADKGRGREEQQKEGKGGRNFHGAEVRAN